MELRNYCSEQTIPPLFILSTFAEHSCLGAVRSFREAAGSDGTRAVRLMLGCAFAAGFFAYLCGFGYFARGAYPLPYV